MSDTPATIPVHFIQRIIEQDLLDNKNDGRVLTRFPPEPNGYLHIGHAKSICLNFGIAQQFSGNCNLRFDDTNPAKENIEFVEAIKRDVSWLGFEWQQPVLFTSDYFQQLYDFAQVLIKAGKAYVCDLQAEQIREYRGTLTEPGKDSPSRDRSIEENLSLFGAMKNGEFGDGERVLRARIDMSSPNINLRDPVIYRVKRATHHQTGDQWCIYPMYDYAHCMSDALEGITHSLCTLEFEDHRPLYNWFIENSGVDCHPQQIEFSRLSLEHTVVSKRVLSSLVENGHVSGWDDPRMPTLAGMRRRGYSPAALRDFCQKIGVTKSDNMVEMAFLESCVREDLQDRALRVMGVLKPLKVTIENFPEGKTEELTAPNHPQDESMGTRIVPFSRTVYIDREDFRESANKKYKRLITDSEVRLRYGYVIRCNEVIKDEQGEIIELRCTYDPDTLGVNPEGRKVRGVIHWVSAEQALESEVRVYDRLFTAADPAAEEDIASVLNPESLTVFPQAKLEPGLINAAIGQGYQFEREGYFCRDIADSDGGKPVFNRTVALRDSWAKIEKKG
ncbi:MAG: glutamine--tRNA ligase/YqeY domain fusion protein [Pseudomonadales bacterium]|nr:glutamine--tRNA ligase/YqeY domain fusion protein [Pseudomonadales bacterium]